ncbi:MAG: DUF6688 family protein, partial [Oscillospiraceae bacterium]
FSMYFVEKNDKKYNKIIETIAMILGLVYSVIYIGLCEILFEPWNVQLSNNQMHGMIAPENILTIVTLSILGFIGYLFIRYVPAKKQPPLLSALGISAVYIGIIISIIWCIQTFRGIFLLILPANCILIYIKSVFIFVYEKNRLIESKQVSLKYKKIAKLLNKATNLPWIALLLLLPLLGVAIAILFLFGQEPDAIIKAWTQTADWTLSQRVGPANIQYDEHYLCTVAAGGHKKIVKPFRTGLRHGHRVLVNRQLCVANAFEQVIEEKTPNFHRVVRGFYDKTGYPISKHINTKVLADIIYFIMKPLEWIFLIVLYSVDVAPENRIALQYPHTKKPVGY